MENEDDPAQPPTNETCIIQEQAGPLTPLASPSSSSSPKPSVSSPWDIQTYDHPTSPYRWFASLAKRCGRIYSLAVSSDSGLVYLGSDSKYIRVWKLPGFAEYGRLRSGSAVVKALVVSSEDGLLFSAHSDNKIRVWECRPAHRRKGTLPSLRDRFTETCLNRPKSFLTSHHHSSSYSKLGHSGEITSLAYSSSLQGKFLYSASMDKTVKVWNIGSMKCVETIRAHDDHINAIALGPDGLLFSGSDDMTVKIWRRSLGGDRSHGLVLNLHVQNSPVKALALGSEEGETEDSYVLYAGCSDGYVHYWKKGELSGHMSYCGFLRGHSHSVLCLSAVEKLLISGSADTSIRVWRRSSEGLAMHTCIATLSGHIGPVKGVVGSLGDQEGCLVYSGSLDGSVKLWWVWREEACASDGGDGIIGDQMGTSWADYFEISKSFGRMQF